MDSKYHSEYEMQFKPSRRQLRSECPWARDTIEQVGKPPEPVQFKYDEEDVAGHTSARMNKHAVLGPQRNHNRLCQRTSGGVLGYGRDEPSDPHTKYFDEMASKDNYAGVRPRKQDYLRKPGISPRGRMNEVIPLQERDPVREAKMDRLCEGRAGVRSHHDPKPIRRLGLPHNDVMDEVVLGREMEPEAHRAMDAKQRYSMVHWPDDAAGVPSGDLEETWAAEGRLHAGAPRGAKYHREGPFRMGTVVGATVRGSDIQIDESYQETYRSTAGFSPRSAARVKQRSASAPGGRRQSAGAAGKSAAEQNSRNKPPFRF